ncbi:TRP-domain-containing protein [Patellaria atrata CBS 101060]|uniref:TRP-domain-containing protein n=1 Tax=Patellaria atrata CBS 101060 TaxID=1346257 RepID=A0A9P4SGF5_9PEZI|nr:TRP-domain-containing protein [Patellaria atrata CBS 101060]
MRYSQSTLSILIAALLTLLPFTSAIRLIESRSLNPCQKNSSFSATLFNVVFTPDNNTLTFEIVGVSEISGKVTADLQAFVYGYQAFKQTIDPCDSEDLAGLCPMNTGTINIESNAVLDADTVKQIPGVAYTIPDLDGRVRVYINDTEGKALACVEAELSNGNTVYQKAVGWVTAVIAGLGLLASAITSGLGHTNTAAHVAANAMSLFGYFQAQAFLGMAAVDLPPVAGSWTQNFQWSMGLIRVSFLQKLATWYQRATGGKPATLLSSLATTSVQVQKRSLEVMHRLLKRAYVDIAARSNNQVTQAETSKTITVHGIERVAFRARIESTNIFMTGYIFFVIFVLLVVLGVIVFKYACEALSKAGKMKSDKFSDFRNGWKTVLKGIMFRIVLIGFPQMVVLCFYELTRRDSAAEVVLAIFTLVCMIGILGWASSKVIRIAQRSIAMHKNPAYILYSDPVSLNKWGFLYVQFKASAYYYIVPCLIYVLVKGMFIGLAQSSGVAQAVALVIIEAGFLISLSIMRPYMDKKTNGFNIAISAINFLSAIFLLVFSNVFNQPGIVNGVMGVIFFIYNAAFALILLLMVLISSGYAIFSKNPDTRYQPMRDDRGSFIKSQTQLTTELDALGATARGEGKEGYGQRKALDEDDDSFSSGSVARDTQFPKSAESGLNPPAPSTGSDNRHAPPGYGNPRSNTASPVPSAGYAASNRSDRFRQQNNSSPWQRGAGYDGH